MEYLLGLPVIHSFSNGHTFRCKRLRKDNIHLIYLNKYTKNLLFI